jgi:hypothetical protein
MKQRDEKYKKEITDRELRELFSLLHHGSLCTAENHCVVLKHARFIYLQIDLGGPPVEFAKTIYISAYICMYTNIL